MQVGNLPHDTGVHGLVSSSQFEQTKCSPLPRCSVLLRRVIAKLPNGYVEKLQRGDIDMLQVGAVLVLACSISLRRRSSVFCRSEIRDRVCLTAGLLTGIWKRNALCCMRRL